MSRFRTTLCLTAGLGLLWAAGLLADDRPPSPPSPPEKRAEGAPPREGQPPDRGPRRGQREGNVDEPAPPPGPGGERRRGPREGDLDRPPAGGPENPQGPPRRRPQRDGGFDQPQPTPPREGDGPVGPERRHPAGPPERRPGPEGRPGMEGPPREGRPGPEGGPMRWPHQDFGAMERSDPEMFKLLREDMELERRTREVGNQVRQAPPDKREELKKQLVELVNKQFEIRHERRMLDLKRLEGELTKLRESIDRRMKARREIIERRVAELVGSESDVSF